MGIWFDSSILFTLIVKPTDTQLETKSISHCVPKNEKGVNISIPFFCASIKEAGARHVLTSWRTGTLVKKLAEHCRHRSEPLKAQEVMLLARGWATADSRKSAFSMPQTTPGSRGGRADSWRFPSERINKAIHVEVPNQLWASLFSSPSALQILQISCPSQAAEQVASKKPKALQFRHCSTP